MFVEEILPIFVKTLVHIDCSFFLNFPFINFLRSLAYLWFSRSVCHFLVNPVSLFFLILVPPYWFDLLQLSILKFKLFFIESSGFVGWHSFIRVMWFSWNYLWSEGTIFHLSCLSDQFELFTLSRLLIQFFDQPLSMLSLIRLAGYWCLRSQITSYSLSSLWKGHSWMQRWTFADFVVCS